MGCTDSDDASIKMLKHTYFNSGLWPH